MLKFISALVFSSKQKWYYSQKSFRNQSVLKDKGSYQNDLIKEFRDDLFVQSPNLNLWRQFHSV